MHPCIEKKCPGSETAMYKKRSVVGTGDLGMAIQM